MMPQFNGVRAHGMHPDDPRAPDCDIGGNASLAEYDWKTGGP
ncbi:MAG: hypothetical protein AB8B82_17090 [Roseovarius sp.]